MATYKMIKLAASILAACSITACAADNGYSYRAQGGYSVEERSYGTSYGGTTWYREEIPYSPYPAYNQNRNVVPNNGEIDRNRNGIPDYREADRNRNGIPDNREVDRNHNGIPDQREQDRNHNGIPDSKEYDRSKEGKSDRADPNWSSNSNRKNPSDDKYGNGYNKPDYNNGRPNNNYGNGNYYGR